MKRAALRIILDVILTILVSIALITLFLFVFTGNVLDSVGEGARLMFLFMDVGLLVWVVLLVIATARSHGGRPRGGGVLLFAVVGALINLLVVIVVGLIQQGGWEQTLVLFAVEAGIAFLLAALIVVPIVHRLLVKPRAEV